MILKRNSWTTDFLLKNRAVAATHRLIQARAIDSVTSTRISTALSDLQVPARANRDALRQLNSLRSIPPIEPAVFDHARRADVANLFSILSAHTGVPSDAHAVEVVDEGERRLGSGGEEAVLDGGLGEEREAVDQVRVGDSEGVVVVAEGVDFQEGVLEVGEAHGVAVVELLVLEDEAGLAEAVVDGGDDVVVVVVVIVGGGAVGGGEGGGGGRRREHRRGVVERGEVVGGWLRREMRFACLERRRRVGGVGLGAVVVDGAALFLHFYRNSLPVY